MNILYELDNNFAPQVSASMTSVCENNKDVDVLDFYVFGLGLSDEVKHNLCAVGAAYGRSVNMVDIDGFMDEFGDFDTFGWNEIVLSRLLVDRFLPASVERVLHLDGDTIVRGSLVRLWNTVLGPRYVVGAVIEPTVDRARIGQLGLAREPYFNAGVLLIDLAQWRAEGVEQGIMEYCRTNHQKLFANDQDAINAYLKGRIKPLPPTYNYCNSYEFYPYTTLLKLMDGVPYYVEREVSEAKKDPCIVHYLGEERPWRAGNKHAYRDDYRRYLKMTPYADTPDETGWEAYFVAWNVYNAATRPFPMMRYRIITALIPKMLAMRKTQRTS